VKNFKPDEVRIYKLGIRSRPLVYADTSETLSALWDRRGKQLRDVHFGMPGHVFISWVFAYSVLKAASDFAWTRISRGDLHSSAVLKGVPDSGAVRFLARSDQRGELEKCYISME
jgi:hypothetical protein